MHKKSPSAAHRGMMCTQIVALIGRIASSVLASTYRRADNGQAHRTEACHGGGVALRIVAATDPQVVNLSWLACSSTDGGLFSYAPTQEMHIANLPEPSIDQSQLSQADNPLDTKPRCRQQCACLLRSYGAVYCIFSVANGGTLAYPCVGDAIHDHYRVHIRDAGSAFLHENFGRVRGVIDGVPGVVAAP